MLCTASILPHVCMGTAIILYCMPYTMLSQFQSMVYYYTRKVCDILSTYIPMIVAFVEQLYYPRVEVLHPDLLPHLVAQSWYAIASVQCCIHQSIVNFLSNQHDHCFFLDPVTYHCCTPTLQHSYIFPL